MDLLGLLNAILVMKKSKAHSKIKVAIVQAAPVYYNLPKSLTKALALITDAASNGAKIIAFGETWLSGYPAWLDMCSDAAIWNHEPTRELFATLKENSITIGGSETQKLSALAKKLKVVIAIGANEKLEKGKANGTLFNSFLLFDEKGNLAAHHRKLIPTYTERLLWGQGAGDDLNVAETGSGKIGGLICWEHWMPLTRQHMHNLGEEIHIAMWPSVSDMHQIASRHYAFEGRCFVLACGLIMPKKDMPKGFAVAEKYAKSKSDFYINGGSCIIAPDGKFIVLPVFDKEEIIIAEIDLREISKGQMSLDVTGHYNRDDVFEFNLKK